MVARLYKAQGGLSLPGHRSSAGFAPTTTNALKNALTAPKATGWIAGAGSTSQLRGLDALAFDFGAFLNKPPRQMGEGEPKSRSFTTPALKQPVGGPASKQQGDGPSAPQVIDGEGNKQQQG